jgi:DNA-binding MarR family transcriptional regulator
MTTRRDTSKAAAAAELWRRLFDFFIATRHQRDRVLARLGLTPNDARALGSLDLHEGRSMRSLAEAWGCDASNVTWMIDRLEQRGLAERRSVQVDRRVKQVVLTPLGVKTKADLLEGVYQPPPELLELDRADLDALRKAVAKLPAEPYRPDGIEQQ